VTALQWIKSAGGPLVVMGSDLAPLWRGYGGNSARFGEFGQRLETDYVRACEIKDYVGVVDVADGYSLVLGDMPLATSVSVDGLGRNLIVRPIFMDPDDDLTSLVRGVADADLGKELESIEFSVKNSRMVIFDSALSGDDLGEECLSFLISAGNYKIVTYEFKPSSRVSSILHIFNVLV
jgi:hypothetical protein